MYQTQLFYTVFIKMVSLENIQAIWKNWQYNHEQNRIIFALWGLHWGWGLKKVRNAKHEDTYMISHDYNKRRVT